jgi:hypothetical protein
MPSVRDMDKQVAGMTALEVAMKIRKCIELLGKMVTDLDGVSARKAETIGDYDRLIGEATATMKGDGHPATLIPTLAKSACYKARKEMESASDAKKDLLTKIEVTKTAMMGWQSIHKHFDLI